MQIPVNLHSWGHVGLWVMLQKKCSQVLVSLLLHANYRAPDLDLCFRVKTITGSYADSFNREPSTYSNVAYSSTSYKRDIIFLSTAFFFFQVKVVIKREKKKNTHNFHLY